MERTQPPGDRDPNPRVDTIQYDDPGKGPLGAVPHLQARTVIGVFDRAESAEAAVAELQRAGHSPDDVSIVRQGEGGAPEYSADETKAGTGIAAGASAGALIGGAIGLAALAIPGVGPLLAAGPIAAALTGVVAGGALGALAGSFAGLGVPTEEAKEYESAVRAGGLVIAVKAPDDGAAQRVIQLLERAGARDAKSYQPAL